MGLIPEEIINQILDRSDIVEIISAYVPLKRAGKNFKANCPFHNEKTPSFVVNPDKHIFHCFGCGVGGNVVSFLMQQERLEFPEAIRWLAQKAGISIPTDEDTSKRFAFREQLFSVNHSAAGFFHQILMTHKNREVQEAREYLKKRGVTPEMVKKFQIGFALDQWDGLNLFLKGKNIPTNLMEKAGLIIMKEGGGGFYDRFRNRIIFPIFDVKSQCLGFGARAIKESGAKYINSPETTIYIKGHHLYGLHLAKEGIARQDAVIIVEGYMDFIMPFQSGVNNIVASLGTALTVEQIRLIRRYTRNIIMVFDADQAGESAMLRSLHLLIEEGMNVKIGALEKGEDPDSFVRKYGPQAFQEKIAKAESFFDFQLKNLMSKHNSKTVEGRAKISMEMLATLNKFDNAIIRNGYLKQLSDTLAVSESALAQELDKFSVRSDKTTPPVNVKTESQINIPPTAEFNILKLVLEDDQFIPLAQNEISLEDFRDQEIRTVMNKIFALFNEGKVINFSNLIACFKDSSILKKISELMTLEDFRGDKTKIYHDCISRIKRDRSKREREDIRHKIKLAEMSGDIEMLEILKERFNQLIKR